MKKVERDVRNAEIMKKFNSGTKIAELAKEYGMTYVGIYQILGSKKRSKVVAEAPVITETVGEPIVEDLLPKEEEKAQ